MLCFSELILAGAFELVLCGQLIKNQQFALSSQICNSKLQVNGQPVIFCEKSTILQSKTQSANFIHSSYEPMFYSINTETVKDYNLDFTFSPTPLPSFSLLGLTTAIEIRDSKISVTAPSELAEGALICLQCEVTAFSSQFAFIASGFNVSGLVSSGKSLMQTDCLVQFRLTGQLVGMVAHAETMTISLTNVNVTAYFMESATKGVFCGSVSVQLQLNVNNVQICSTESNVGSGAEFLTLTGILTPNCVICPESSFFAYGICLSSLIQSDLTGDKLICKPTFVFSGECSCEPGYIVNGSVCVNVLSTLNNVLVQQDGFQAQLNNLDQYIAANISQLNQSTNTSLTNILTQLTNISTYLDQLAASNTLTNNSVNTVNSTLQDLIKEIECTAFYGKEYTADKQCVQNGCSITGQQRINGMCQCSNINAFVQGQVCVCPTGASLVVNVCTCPGGKVLNAGKDACE
ncbi:Hypothetical_protein [Hexamita inflata]|uniref:Hypothetical_protein n=1 Tax=Hexamita inflata TaxID=28002 RepID=A0AA86RGS9_9EUKA|nr:Hypothetical protein HINF_LOCUS65255 [Hexamita inflata]